MSSRQPLASVAVTAIRKGDIVALGQALQQDPALSTPQLTDSAPSSTSPPTGPATFPTTPPASRNWSRPAPTSTRLSSAAIPKRRSTGLPAPMTSRCSIPCSIMVPISKPLAAPSVAERHWRMRLPSGNGKRRGGWSSGAPKPRCADRGAATDAPRDRLSGRCCKACSGRRHQYILVCLPWRTTPGHRIPAGTWRRIELGRA